MGVVVGAMCLLLVCLSPAPGTVFRKWIKTVPAAAVVKDGKIVWRGHPSRLSESMIKKWL